MSEKPAKNREKLTYFFAAPDSELASTLEGEKRRISGYAARYGGYSADRGGYRATIAPGAFDRALTSADVRLLINHDPNLLMARTRSGSLRVAADERGLFFDASLPDTPLAAHYAEEIRRGDMDGCSFTCTIDIDQWDFTGETPIRTIIEVGELYDVGPVTFPAFDDTSVSSHSSSLEHARTAILHEFEAGARRARRAHALRLMISLGAVAPERASSWQR